MKKCKNSWWFWETEEYPNNLTIPEKCLSYTIFNKAGVNVMIDKSEVLEAGEYYPVEHHVGYYHTGQIKLDKVTEGSSDLHIRFTIED